MKKDSKNSGLKKKASKKSIIKGKEANKKAAAVKPSKKPAEKSKKVHTKSAPTAKNTVKPKSSDKKASPKNISGKKTSPKKAVKAAPIKKSTKKVTAPDTRKVKVSTLKKPSLKAKDTKKPKAKINIPVKKAKEPEKPEKKNKVSPVEKILTKGLKKVKQAGKKVVERIAEVVKPEKAKVQSKPKTKPVSAEPEPDFADLENIDLGEITIKEKPKKPKSRKNLLKRKEENVVHEIRRMPIPDLSAINYNNFKKSEKPEPAKIEAQPSVLIKTEVKKADPIKAEIKNRIFEKCLTMQTDSVNIAKRAMNDAQESANEEKGSMEEKFDSFRESMHITRDMYARQFQEGMNSLSMLKRINPNLEHNTVILGSVVYTDFQNYFVSVSLGEISVDDDKFITISTSTPLFQALSGKSKGDKFKFRDKVYTIKDVF